jgi:tensin
MNEFVVSFCVRLPCRDAVCHALQQADYGAFILRDSTTHVDCYALSVKVPKFTHDSHIAHYLIEKILDNHTYHYRIKGTMKQFPTLLSLLTHHSVMPEILPITLNLHAVIPI